MTVIHHPEPKPPDTNNEAVVHGTASQPEDFPRLVFTAPYFEQAPLAELFEPAVIEAAKDVLPGLVQPAADQAAEEAVRQLAVMRAGDTMDGPLYLSELLPAADYEAASKYYVDALTTGSDLTHALLDDLASPTAGDGNVTVRGDLSVGGDITAKGGLWANGQTGTFGLDAEPPFYVLHWGGAGYVDLFDSRTGTRYWSTPDGNPMTLSAAGALSVLGSITSPSLSVTGLLSAGSAAITGTLAAGNTTITGTTTITGALTAASATTTGNVTAADVIAKQGVWANNQNGTFGFDAEPPYYVWHWGGTGYQDLFDSTTGIRYWSTPTANPMTLTPAGALTVTGPVQGSAVQGYSATGRGGFVGSYEGDAGSNVGFWNSGGVIEFGNADGLGVPNTAAVRMTIDASNNVVSRAGIYAVNEVHVSGKGVYYTAIDPSELHAIAFLWTGTRLDAYVDKLRVGSIPLGALEMAEDATALRDRIAALEARIAALEAAAP